MEHFVRRSRATILHRTELTGILQGWVQEVRKTLKGRKYFAFISPTGAVFPSKAAALSSLSSNTSKTIRKKRKSTNVVNQSNHNPREKHKQFIRKQRSLIRNPLINEEGDIVPKEPQRSINQNVPHVGKYPAGDDLPNWTVEHVETVDGNAFLLYRDPNGVAVGSRGTALLMTGQLEIPENVRDQIREEHLKRTQHEDALKRLVGFMRSEHSTDTLALNPSPEIDYWKRLYNQHFSDVSRKRIVAQHRRENTLESQLVVVDLFCGIGGFSLGAQSSGISHIFGVDMEAGCISSYRANECGTRSMVHKLRMSDMNHWVELLEPVKERLIVLASPPCQPYSCTGVGNGCSDERDGLPFVVELCKRVKPLAIIIENVSAMLHTRHASTIEPKFNTLRDEGFHVFPFQVNCSDHGIAQTRKRAIVIGLNRSIGDDCIEPALTPENELPKAPTSFDVLHDFKTLWKGSCPKDLKIIPSLIRSRLRINPGSELTGVVRPDAPAPTVLTTALHDNSYYRMVAIPKCKHRHALTNGDLRALNIQHILRLQSFPDNYRLFNHMRFQSHCVGNAIPPMLARNVIQATLRSMKHISFTSNIDHRTLDDMLNRLKQDACDRFDGTTPVCK
jgi:DNA (cytosine-5)-methyltransferase 1